jgi:alpha-ketoglutarate-dependent taurine dioxygenase
VTPISTPTRTPDLSTTPEGVHVLRVEAFRSPATATDWAARHRDLVREQAARHGAVVVRGLGITDHDQAATVLTALGGGGLVTEREAFAARTEHRARVYSSAPWPSDQPMCAHHELGYVDPAPGLVLLACLTPASEGGATGLVDGEEMLRTLPSDLVARFERDGWMLARSYSDEIGASWAEAFGTEDRAEVEAYCAAHAIEISWQPGNGLRTRQRRPAVVRHPATGRRTWFNQVAFLSRWALEPDVREFLVDEYGAEGLPFDTSYGDASPIDESVVATINDAAAAATRRVPWQAGDVMVIDNIRTAHSREPYTGRRELLLAMAEPVAVQGVEAPR